jgi:hypothetical protein
MEPYLCYPYWIHALFYITTDGIKWTKEHLQKTDCVKSATEPWQLKSVPDFNHCVLTILTHGQAERPKIYIWSSTQPSPTSIAFFDI